MYFLTRWIPVMFIQMVIGLNGYSQGSIGIFDGHSDIGEVIKRGSATYDALKQQYEVSGAGYNIWGDHDEFHFVWKKIKGDFIVYTRARFVGQGVDPHRKLGWMARASLDGASAHISAAVHGDGLTSLQYRRSRAAQTEEQKSSLTHADVIQLERKGSDFIMRVAKFGEPFVVTTLQGLKLDEEIYVGLFVGSHNKDVIETGVFNDVRFIRPASDSLIENRGYAGSLLELLDVDTGKREIVLEEPNAIQAPNWTRDGKTLIYNKDGGLYNFDLETRKPTPLNTGDRIDINNAHALSFDGRQIAFSSEVPSLGGSIIHGMSFEKGKPLIISPVGPSYVHGWSPDGKYVIYTAERYGEYDIYKKPVNANAEIQLTKVPGLDVGAEYSPDGKYIYFSSNRTGTMQIWRMNANGSNAVPVTKGDYHDWFPHVSPDGKRIVFLSYDKNEVAAHETPYYKNVYLRMMSPGRDQPVIIAYVYGGQGTINNASWSPDSNKIAFVSNSY